MTNSQRIAMLRKLDRAGFRDLSTMESCKSLEVETPHERLMFAAGFRKGVRQAIRGIRTFDRARARAGRARVGDTAWARGFSAGVNFVPADANGKKTRDKAKNRKKTQKKFSKRELLRIKRDGF